MGVSYALGKGRQSADWAWEDESPTDWTPSITMADDGSAEVRFLTYSGHLPERIVEHRDILLEEVTCRPRDGEK